MRPTLPLALALDEAVQELRAIDVEEARLRLEQEADDAENAYILAEIDRDRAIEEEDEMLQQWADWQVDRLQDDWSDDV